MLQIHMMYWCRDMKRETRKSDWLSGKVMSPWTLKFFCLMIIQFCRVWRSTESKCNVSQLRGRLRRKRKIPLPRSPHCLRVLYCRLKLVMLYWDAWLQFSSSTMNLSYSSVTAMSSSTAWSGWVPHLTLPWSHHTGHCRDWGEAQDHHGWGWLQSSAPVQNHKL